ncbi:hypothetical protein ACLI09_15675 [Flavobacterium sp. RHBU_24]|uniref:hypothetical protein n=1 Tax=Flavobacterium sp. RHBU_24 TaxID=3391185 RepID=UPI003985144F
MRALLALSDFFQAIDNDQRITMRHIGLYAALLYIWETDGFKNPICLFSKEIMAVAKIFASASYHRYIKQLDEYGYIRYEPSFKKNQASKIYLLALVST